MGQRARRENAARGATVRVNGDAKRPKLESIDVGGTCKGRGARICDLYGTNALRVMACRG